MSLFIGNISKYVQTFELEDEFNRFGHCEIKRNVSNGSYAFIEFQSEKAAEDAMNQIQGLNLKGLEIGIEWSKRSQKYDSRDSKRPPRRESDSKCYNCNRIGHFARECRSRRRSRSRSGERRQRDSRSRSPPRGGDRDRRGGGRDYRDDRRRSPDRRRRSPRRDSFDRRDDRRRDDSYDRRDDRRRSPAHRSPPRGGDDNWQSGGAKHEERRSFSRGHSQPRSPADQYRRRSPAADEGRRRSHSRGNSQAKDRRPVDDHPKSPAGGNNERPQNDEREVNNPVEVLNPERQAPRDDGPAQAEKQD